MPTYPLLFIPTQPETMRYKGSGFGKKKYPQQNRETHGKRIAMLLEAAWESNAKAAEQRSAVSLPAKNGIYLEVKGFVDHDLAIQSLASSGVELRNVRKIQEAGAITTIAIIFIPEENKSNFVKKIQSYTSGEMTRFGKPQNNDLVRGIEAICLAGLDVLWTDAKEEMPQDTPAWCEIWLKGDTKYVFQQFIEHTEHLGIESNTSSYLQFPERTVVLAKINREIFNHLLVYSSDIAECRLAREPAEFFTDISPREQSNWATEFLKHAKFVPNPQVSVCVLDTGVNNGHPLIVPVLNDEDMHTVNPDWGTHDHHGHGTGMAGIAAYGDVAAALATPQGIKVAHCLESCKIRPPQNDLPPELYGFVTVQAVQQAKVVAPQLRRQVCMAVSAHSPFADRGEPTSWSAAIDSLAAGVDDDVKNLVIICAGNIPADEYSNYPDANLIRMAEDPAQAWNALTVGAYTELDHADGCEPIASKGQLSPFSRTSCTWKRQWPSKPDVVFEGGNIGRDAIGFHGTHDALSVLTTSRQIPHRMFTHFNATSAATAEAAWFAAQIQVAYPEAWPETLRALMVHSADWTPAMHEQFAPAGNKTQLAMLKRICGYGVPSLERALHCMNNSLVLVAERELQPYSTERNSKNKSHDIMQMHFFEVPWPKEELEALGATSITMRVTLSYFIEPGPGQRGWKDKYRYASHGLRFDICGAQENREDFKQRISKIIKEYEEYQETDTSRKSSSYSQRWVIGSNGRSSGSIHSDILVGTAAEIASYNKIAVFPVVGWWRERKHLKKSASKARYSLIVSLHTEAQDVDIYTPVKIKIDTTIKTPVPITV